MSECRYEADFRPYLVDLGSDWLDVFPVAVTAAQCGDQRKVVDSVGFDRFGNNQMSSVLYAFIQYSKLFEIFKIFISLIHI